MGDSSDATRASLEPALKMADLLNKKVADVQKCARFTGERAGRAEEK